MRMFSVGQVLQIFPSDAPANIISSHKHTSGSTWFHLLSSYVSPTVSMPYTTLTVCTWLKNYECLFLMLNATRLPLALSALPPSLLCHSLEFTSKPEAEICSPASFSFFIEAICFCIVAGITGLGHSTVHVSL